MSPIHSGAINKHFCIMQGLRAHFRVRQGDKPGLETKADIFVFMRRSRCIFGVAWAAAGRVASWQIVSSATQIHEELQPLVFLFCFSVVTSSWPTATRPAGRDTATRAERWRPQDPPRDAVWKQWMCGESD